MTNTQKNQILRTLGDTPAACLPRHLKQQVSRAFPATPIFKGKPLAQDCFKRDVPPAFTLGGKYSNQCCNFSQITKEQFESTIANNYSNTISFC